VPDCRGLRRIRCDLSGNDNRLIHGIFIIAAIKARWIDQTVTVLDVEEVTGISGPSARPDIIIP
jgi:hypothetical protein